MNNRNSAWIKLGVILTLSFCYINAYAQKKKEITPLVFTEQVYLTGDHKFEYYGLSEVTSTKVEVEGPGILTAYNRVRLQYEQVNSQPYYLKYLIDNRFRSTIKIPPKGPSDKVWYHGGVKGVPSKAVLTEVPIPPGKHLLEFSKIGTPQEVHIRFVFTKRGKMNWKEIGSEVRLNRIPVIHPASNSRRIYSRITASNAFTFRPDGSQKIRIYLRAEFDYKTHQQDIIRLQLKQNGKVIATYKATCFRSEETEYLDERHLVPGTLRKFYVDIDPEEKGLYELSLKETEKSALVRVALGRPRNSGGVAKL